MREDGTINGKNEEQLMTPSPTLSNELKPRRYK